MKKATVSAGIFRSISNFAVEHGADKQSLFANAQVDEAILADQDARIPFEAYVTLIRDALAQTGDPLLLLKHSLDTRIENITVVGLIVGSAASFPDAMEQLNRYAKLMVALDIMDGKQRFEVSIANGEFWIIDNRPDPNSFPELTEASFGRLIGEFRYNFPNLPYALQIEMTHSAPSHVDQVQELLGCPVHYNCTRNAIQIDPSWLERPFENTSRYAFGIFTDKADALLEQLESSDTIRARVEAQILADMHKGNFSIDDTASLLGMSRATLYRRLKEEGTTFAQVVDELRCQLASDYLSARKVSVNETAYLVGFSEASSFVRAFRRWTGQTPSEYRDQLAVPAS